MSRSKPKILAIGHAWVVDSYRSILHHIALKHGYDITLIVPDWWIEGGKRIEAKTEDPAINIVALKPISHRQHTHIYPTLPFYLRKENPDIIFLWEEPNSLVTAFTLLTKSLISPFSKSIFYTFLNDGRVFRKMPGMRKITMPLSCFLTFHFADACVGCSSDSTAEMKSRGFPKTTVKIPWGINYSLSSPHNRTFTKQPNIGFVGRLTTGKGISLLLEAVSKIPKTEYNKIIIVGNGPEETNLKDQAKRLRISERVEFRGHIQQAQIKTVLREIEILAIPSRKEGNWVEQFGRIIIEGLEQSCLVVGSDSGEIPHVIQNHGFIFRENDVIDLLNKLEGVLKLSISEKKERASKAFDYGRDNFSYEMLSDSYNKLFNKVGTLTKYHSTI